MTAEPLFGPERKAAMFRQLLPKLNSPSGNPLKEVAYPGRDGRVWSFCPAHPDGTKRHHRSLSLSEKLGLHCFAGCQFLEIIDAFGIERKRPTEPEAPTSINRPRPAAPVATGEPNRLYVYRAPDGAVVAEKGRWDHGADKTFRWRKPGGSWKDGIAPLKMTDMPLWGAELVAAGPPDAVVYLVEGEKAAEACRARGLLAVTCAGGAATVEFGAALEVLKGHPVRLWPDNDSVGRAFMQRGEAALHGIATTVETVDVALPDKGDAHEYFAAGGTVADITIRQAAEPEPAQSPPITVQRGVLAQQILIPDSHRFVLRAENVRQERTGIHARVSIELDGIVHAWSNFNVERDEDRVRLANSVYKQVGPSLKTLYEDKLLKLNLDQFCAGLWDAQIGEYAPVMMAGAETARPPSFLLYPFVLTEGGTIIFAPPGRGKSYAMMLMAVSIDAGISTLWRPISRANVLFINLERGAQSVASRLGNVNEVLGLPRGRKLATINARGRSLVDVAAAAERHIGEYGTQVVLIDSISRAGAGDLNANDNVNRIIDMANRMCPAWVGLAHTPRNDESHLYGGVHFEAGADVVVQLLSEQEDDGPLGIGLQITKQNDIGKVPMWMMALEFAPPGLATVRHARPGEFTEIEASKRMTVKEQVRQHLLDVGAQSATEIALATGLNRAAVSAVLTKDAAFETTGKSGRNVLYVVRGHV